MWRNFIIFPIFFAAVFAGRCLKHFRVLGTTTSSITLAWNYTCDHEVNYKVYFLHKGWLACPQNTFDGARGPGRGNLETSEPVIVLENLYPWSLYELSIKALATNRETGRAVSPPDEENVVGETLPDLPGIAPHESTIPTPRATSTSLRFNWRQPPQSRCKDFHTDLDGTHYVLKGTSPWNLDHLIKGDTSKTAAHFQDLQPFSEYSLFLYATDTLGRHNPDIFYRIPAKTLPGEPQPPINLTESSRNGESKVRLLKWKPPYPPTGQIRQYKLRWKLQNASIWMDYAEVKPTNDLCNDLDMTSSVCQAVHDLDPASNYTFQVCSMIRGSDGCSNWSESFISPTISNSTVLGMEKSVFVIAMISGLVGVFILLLAGSLLMAKMKKRNKYGNVPGYEARPLTLPLASPQSPTSPVPPFGSNTARTSFASTLPPESLRKYQQHLLPMEQISRPGSIQEVPLPPLPPGDHVYEELPLKNEENKKKTPPSSLDLALKEEEEGSSEYLAPRRSLSRKASADTLDMEDYLKPTFDRFEHIDTKDLSPPREAPPPIPTVSYAAPNKNKM